MQQKSKMPTNFRILLNKVRFFIDRISIYSKQRWLFYVLVFICFFARMAYLDGYYAIMYLYSFYVVQNVIQYITPSELPTIQEEEENPETIYDIPDNTSFVKNQDESKPVIRKLGEFKLWLINEEENYVWCTRLSFNDIFRAL